MKKILMTFLLLFVFSSIMTTLLAVDNFDSITVETMLDENSVEMEENENIESAKPDIFLDTLFLVENTLSKYTSTLLLSYNGDLYHTPPFEPPRN
jgi:hypothetical protein